MGLALHNLILSMVQKSLSSVQFSLSVVSDSLQPHGLQHARLPCASPNPGACSNLCSLSQCWHLTISSFVIPFSSCLQSFPASGSFLMRWLFAIGASASASVLPINIQDWSPCGWTCLISLQSNGLSRVFSNTTVQKHQFFDLNEINVLIKENWERSFPFPHVRIQWRLIRELLLGHAHVGIWSWTSQPPELWEVNFYCL